MNEMRNQQFAEAHTWVRAELDRCVNFWLKNGMDPEFGGVYTCLDRTGKIYSTDKSVWMQGRCGWIFAHLCTVYGTKPEWLDASRSCLDFMERHCFNHAAGDRMYFTVTKNGQPLRQRLGGGPASQNVHQPVRTQAGQGGGYLDSLRVSGGGNCLCFFTALPLRSGPSGAGCGLWAGAAQGLPLSGGHERRYFRLCPDSFGAFRPWGVGDFVRRQV